MRANMLNTFFQNQKALWLWTLRHGYFPLAIIFALNHITLAHSPDFYFQIRNIFNSIIYFLFGFLFYLTYLFAVFALYVNIDNRQKISKNLSRFVSYLKGFIFYMYIPLTIFLFAFNALLLYLAHIVTKDADATFKISLYILYLLMPFNFLNYIWFPISCVSLHSENPPVTISEGQNEIQLYFSYSLNFAKNSKSLFIYSLVLYTLLNYFLSKFVSIEYFQNLNLNISVIHSAVKTLITYMLLYTIANKAIQQNGENASAA